MTALSFVWVHPYSQISGCDIMDYVDMLFFKMSSKAVIPTRATEHSVGLDVYSPSHYIMPPLQPSTDTNTN